MKKEPLLAMSSGLPSRLHSTLFVTFVALGAIQAFGADLLEAIRRDDLGAPCAGSCNQEFSLLQSSLRMRRNDSALSVANATAVAAEEAETTNETISIRRLKRQEDNARLEAAGYFLGFSRDFWLILGLSIGIWVYAWFQTTTNTYFATKWRSEVVPVALPQAPPEFQRGFLQRSVLPRGLTSDVALMMEVAFRKALTCAILALAFFVQPLNFLNQQGFTMLQVANVVILNVSKDLGGTVCNTWNNFYGNLVPALHVVWMYSLYPHGVEETYDSAWWFAVIDFIVYSSIFLLLNFPSSSRMFALSCQVVFTAEFLNPNRTNLYSQGFRNLTLHCNAMGPLVGALLGSIAALVVIGPGIWGHIPSALGYAQEDSIQLAWREGRVWSRLVKYYSGAEKTVEIERILGEAKLLDKGNAELNAHLSGTWWETFDVGKPGMVRAHLVEFNERIAYMNDWLVGMAAATRSENFDDSHDALMLKVGPQMEALAESTSQLLWTAGRLAVAGFQPNEAGQDATLTQVRNEMTAVNEAQRSFAAALAAGRVEVYKSDLLTTDAVHEHFFAFGLSSYANYVVSYAEYLVKGERRTKPITPLQAVWDGFKGIFKLTDDFGYLVRGAFSYYAGALVGYFGLQGVMPPLSPGAAATTVFIVSFSGGAGSSVLKNFNRFLGVAFGTIVGRLLFNTCISCEWWGTYTGFMCIFVYLAATLFANYRSSTHGFVAILMAVEGVAQMLKPCDYQGQGIKSFETMQTQMIAIILISITDALIGNQSAGHLAVSTYKSLMDKIFSSTEEVFKLVTPPSNNERRGLRQTLVSLSSKAGDLGAEAAIEPRVVSMPFKEDFWKHVLTEGKSAAISTSLLKFSVVEVQKSQLQPMTLIQAVTSSPALQAFLRSTVARGKTAMSIVDDIMHKETTQSMKSSKGASEALPEPLDMDARMKDITSEMSAAVQKSRVGKAVPSFAAEDGICISAVIIFTLQSISRNVNQLEATCFSSAELMQ